MSDEQYSQDYWRDRDHMAFAGLLLYGAIFTIAVIVFGKVLARDLAVIAAGVAYLSYNCLISHVSFKAAHWLTIASAAIGAAAGVCFIAGI